MAMSPSTATFLLSIPPVRGAVALLLLLLVGAVPFSDGELGVAARLALFVVMLLLGTVVWAATLSGFLRDVREPRRLRGAVVLAHRPRRLARGLSWTALVVVILSALSLGPLATSEVNALALALCLLCLVVALPVASLLPRLSRWYADGAGLVAASPEGLRIVPDRRDEATTIPWARLGMVSPTSSAATSLTDASAETLGARVRWRPGARRAVARWAAEGFDPTAEEVRFLHLDPQWSSDPSTARFPRVDRWRSLALQVWALLVCAVLAGALIWAAAAGEMPWWMLLVLGWAPLLGLAFLAPHLLRILLTTGAPGAGVGPADRY